MSNPLNQPDPPIDTGENPNAPPWGQDASSLPSQWVSATLRDSRLYREFMETVETIRQTIWDAFQALIAVLEIIVALMEAVKILLALIDGIIQLAIKSLILLLQTLKDQFIQLLEDILGIGFYFLPHFLEYDWKQAIKIMLLDPYAGQSNGGTHFNPGQVIPVPSLGRPGHFEYQAVTAPTKRGLGIDQFMEDIRNSFNNQNDRLRPLFSSYMGVSGAFVVIAFPDIFIYVRIICFIMQLVSGKNYGYRFAKIVAKWIYGDLDKAWEVASPEALESALSFLEDVETGFDAIIKGIDQGADVTAPYLQEFSFNVNKMNQYKDMSLGAFMEGRIGSTQIYAEGGGTLKGSVEEGPINGVLGNWRAPIMNYNTTVHVRNGKGYLYVQRQVGSSFAYKNSKVISGMPVGIYLGECKQDSPQQFSGMTAPLEQGTVVLPLDGGTVSDQFPKSKLATSDNSPFAISDGLATTGRGNWYINTKTKTVRTHNGSNWYNSADPNVFIYTVLDENDNVLGQFNVYVVRFKLENEFVSLSGGLEAAYAYGDAFSFASRCKVNLHHSKQYQVGIENGIPQTQVEQLLGLPFQRGSGGGDISFKNIGFSSYFDTCEMELSITLPVNEDPDGNWYAIYNHKLALSGGVTLFSSGFWTKFHNHVSHEGNNTLLTLSHVELNDDLSTLEVCCESQKEVIPTFSGYAGEGGATALGVNIVTYSKLITYTFDRDPVAKQIVITTPETVSPSQVDDMFLARIISSANKGSGNFSLYDFFGDPSLQDNKNVTKDYLKSLFKDQNLEFVGKVYWRGYKGADMGVLIWDSKNKTAVAIYPPDEKTYWRINTPVFLQTGVYSYQIYGFNQSVWNGSQVQSDLTRMKLEVVEKSPESVFTSGLTQALTHVITVSDEIDVRDIPKRFAWRTLNLKQWINIIDPLDQFLQSLIDAIPIPPGIFDPLINWISRIQARIQYWEEIIKMIQEYIDRILRLLDIGDTGFYFLAIENAAGSEGFLDRAMKVEIPTELADLPFATGFVMVAAHDFGGMEMLDFLFDFAPRAPLSGEEPPGERPSATDIVEAAWEKFRDESEAMIEEAGTAMQANAAKADVLRGEGRITISNIGSRDYQKIVSPDSTDTDKKPFPPFFPTKE